jgi:hypothetical protein
MLLDKTAQRRSAMTQAVPRSNWQVQEHRYQQGDDIEFILGRIYEFTDARTPATVSTLEIRCPVTISLSGNIHSYVDFNLRPHLYLELGKLPSPERGMIRAPFVVWLTSEGEGTEASPLIQGGPCKVSWYSDGDEEPDDPELALMRVTASGEIQCLKVLWSGKQMTFTIMGDSEPSTEARGDEVDDRLPTSRKLQLQLPNDGEFGRLYGDICNRLKRHHASRFGEPASSSEGVVGFFRRLFN